jgi:hypothetical protein
MDRHKFVLLEALKAAALQRGEMRLYRRGKLPGLFAQRTRLHAEVANQAVQENLLEVTRVEPIGKTPLEWVRVTQKGIDLLLESESPARALEELREALAVNQQGLPLLVAQMHGRLDELKQRFAEEVDEMRQQLDQLSQRAIQAIERIEAAHSSEPMPAAVLWAQEALEYLDRRKQVGLGERCSLADLFAALMERHAQMTIKEFHAGLKRLQERHLIALLPSTGNGDAPGPEYALLDGAAVYYYVGRAKGSPAPGDSTV